jgi:hypothetical protein
MRFRFHPRDLHLVLALPQPAERFTTARHRSSEREREGSNTRVGELNLEIMVGNRS